MWLSFFLLSCAVPAASSSHLVTSFAFFHVGLRRGDGDHITSFRPGGQSIHLLMARRGFRHGEMVRGCLPIVLWGLIDAVSGMSGGAVIQTLLCRHIRLLYPYFPRIFCCVSCPIQKPSLNPRCSCCPRCGGCDVVHAIILARGRTTC